MRKQLHDAFSVMMGKLHQQQGAVLDIQIMVDPAVTGFIDAHSSVLDSAIQQHTMSEGMRRRLTRSNYIFSGMKTFHELNEAFPSLLDENGERKPFERFLNDVQKIDSTYNGNYLRAEYNFVQASAEMAAKWESFMEDGDHYNLQYRTQGDSHVRPEHAELHGVTLPPSDSFWEEYYPPNGWNCRCTVVQVRKSKYPTTPHDEAVSRGEAALQRDTKGMFRFNPGIEKKTVPDYNPYTIKRCKDCDIASKLASGALDNELCAACQLVRQCWSKKRDNDPETFTECNVNNGRLRVSSKHGKNEKKENVRVGKYLAEKHGYDITLIANPEGTTSADSFNNTLGIEQEYKVNATATKNAIDGLLRKGAKQAEDIVLVIDSEISLEELGNAVSDRTNRSRIKNITIVIGDKDKTYSREEILSKHFKIQLADLN